VNDSTRADPGARPDAVLRLTVQEDNGHAIIAATGEIDASTAPALRAAIRDQVRARRQRLIIDLTGVSYLAAAGVGVLVSAHKHTRTQVNGRFAVVCTAEAALSIRRIKTLTQGLAVYETLDEALRAGS
jgi:anti-anti-sigma factor